MARFCLDNKVGGYRCRSQVPEHEILKIVRMYEPIITEFFDNEEEMAKFQKWREEYEEKEQLEKEEKLRKPRQGVPLPRLNLFQGILALNTFMCYNKLNAKLNRTHF